MPTIKTCICGKKFEVSKCRLRNGRGKFCSKKCQYSHAHRPSGLNYKIVVENKGWFKKGFIPWDKGTKGLLRAWNKGIKGTHFSPKTEFKSEDVIGEKNNKWKGNNVGYCGLHTWVSRNLFKPKKCEHCGEIKKIEWANKSREYKRDINDWIPLCKKCHCKYDRGIFRGVATKKFNLNKKNI